MRWLEKLNVNCFLLMDRINIILLNLPCQNLFYPREPFIIGNCSLILLNNLSRSGLIYSVNTYMFHLIVKSAIANHIIGKCFSECRTSHSLLTGEHVYMPLTLYIFTNNIPFSVFTHTRKKYRK